MPVLVDTSILVRFLDRASTYQPVCIDALRIAKSSNGRFVLCAQVAIEFWSVATRPKNVNGLELTPSEADAAVRDFGEFLPVVLEPPDMLDRWRRLVLEHAVRGRSVHDTRLVALMISAGIDSLLTLNAADLKRYSQIRMLSPQDVVDGKS